MSGQDIKNFLHIRVGIAELVFQRKFQIRSCLWIYAGLLGHQFIDFFEGNFTVAPEKLIFPPGLFFCLYADFCKIHNVQLLSHKHEQI